MKDKVIEIIGGLTAVAPLLWVATSCLNIAFNGYAETWNFFRIMLEIF